MNTLDIYFFAMLFIMANTYFAYRSGQKSGRSEMVVDLLDRKMITKEKIKPKKIFVLFLLYNKCIITPKTIAIIEILFN